MSFSKKDVLLIFLVLLALAVASIPIQVAESDILDSDLPSIRQIQVSSVSQGANS